MPHLYSYYTCHDCQRKKERKKERKKVRKKINEKGETVDGNTCALNEMKNGVREKYEQKIP